MNRIGSPQVNVALLMVRVITDGERKSSMAVMQTVRSVIPFLNELIPQKWSDEEILRRSHYIIPDYHNAYWKRGREIYLLYCEGKGKYTGSEKLLRELIEFAEGLKLKY